MAKTLDYISYLEEIKSLSQDDLVTKVLEYAVNLPPTYDKREVSRFFERSFQDGSLGVIKDRLDVSASCIEDHLITFANIPDLVQKLKTLGNNINNFFGVISAVVAANITPEAEEGLSGKVTSLESFEAKAKELQNRLDNLETKLEKHEGNLNDKLFSLIINTVAILGIFVAVAFAGFGANTIFSQIVFNTADNTIKNVFYLCLTALFVYNLLFLLFYCILKIIEKLSNGEGTKLWENYTIFMVIDIIGLAVVVTLFLLSVFLC